VLHNLQESKLKGLFKINKLFYDENAEFLAELMSEENEKAMAQI
jgi:hypothetical protein